MKKLLLGCSVLTLATTTVAYGADTCRTMVDATSLNKDNLFNATLCIDGNVSHASKNKVEDFIDQFKNAQLGTYFPSYQKDTSVGIFKLDFRGLPMELSYPIQGGTLLTFEVPSLNIHKQFCPDGETTANVCTEGKGSRDETNERFKDYLKKSGDQILKRLTEVSPNDPVAGNPASLETRMAVNQYEAGTSGKFGRSNRTGQIRPSILGVGFRYDTQDIDGRTTKVLDMPFSYNKPLEGDSELILRLPISYTEVESAGSFLMMPSISYKTPVLADNSWVLTPSLGYGVVGSTDLGSVGQIVSAALTSDLLLFQQENYSLSMGNMVGYYKTLPLNLKDYNLDPNISNTMMRNGLLLSVPLQQKLAGMDLVAETYVINTMAFGSPLYEDYYNEVGITIGPEKVSRSAANLSQQAFGIGLSYSWASHSHGFTFSVGYEF
jgi:energy-converting hydrogenase Eha subunit A